MTQTIKIAIAGGTIAALALFGLTPLARAAVSTDKADYSPGETVTIFGDGYWANETVSIAVTAPYGSESGSATTTGSGEFSWSFVLPNNDSSLGEYSYTVTGDASGIVQSGTFSDGNVKIFPIPTTATFSATITIYDNTTCTGNVTDGPDVETGISSPSGETTGVGNTESVKIQAAALSDQGGAFIGWTTSQPYVGTSTTAVSGDTICITGNFTGNHDFFANYGVPPGVLVVQKVLINDNGGTAATTTFSFQINGASTTPFNTQGTVVFSLASSTYSITELAAAGYTTTYSNSTNGNANCTNLSVQSGATTTCTITNDDQAALLTVTKIVINDDGGSATTTDFTLFVGDGSSTTTVSSGVQHSFDAGNYTVGESGPSGYTASFSGDCNDSDGSITLETGGTYTCTITNDDQPASLTLFKFVVNDDGGTATTTDWTLTATGPTGFGGFGPSVTNNDIDAGTYDLSENGPAGYTASAWVCSGGNQTDGDTVEIGPGEKVTCTITNDDVAVAPPGGSSCAPAALGTITIIICNSGTITSTTTAEAETGTNVAQGSSGGDGGNGGDVDPLGDENNGGASAGNGGNGGNGGAGGFIQSGDATSDAGSLNGLNRTEAEVGRDCDCGDINGMTVTIVVDNDPALPAQNTITNLSRSRARSGDNVADGSSGGNGGAGGSVDGGPGNENNGGASAGNGGAGGGSAIGGTIQTGAASSTSGSLNLLNFTRTHVRF